MPYIKFNQIEWESNMDSQKVTFDHPPGRASCSDCTKEIEHGGVYVYYNDGHPCHGHYYCEKCKEK